MTNTWQTVSIAGKSADIFEPSTATPETGALLFLHGHALTTLKDDQVYTPLLVKYGLRAICPHGQRSWWGWRVCTEFDPVINPEDYLRKEIVPWINHTWNISSPLIALTGVSMGGQGVLRLGYRYPREFPIVAAISPAVDFHNWWGRGLPIDEMYRSKESARQETATLEIHPLNWPRNQLLVCDPTDEEWLEGVERLASKLSSTGIPFETDFVTSNGGHGWTYYRHQGPKVIEWIASKIAEERQRV